MNIVVLCGGLSNERDVSITSGSNVAKALKSAGHNVLLVDLFYGYDGDYLDPHELFLTDQKNLDYSVKLETPDVDRMFREGGGGRIGGNVIEICKAADIVFLALHGADGEDGKIQATLDMHGIKYTGSGYLGSAIAMNKELTKTLFAANGIPSPEGIVVSKFDGAYSDVGFPCVVKPCSGGSSVGTSIVNSRDEYAAALDLAFKFEERVLVEKYVRGREFTVGVLSGKAMPIIEIIPKTGWYDYKNKYQAGLTEEICPADIDGDTAQRLSAMAEKVAGVLMIDVYFRADFLMDEKTGCIYCLEANTLPGMTPTSLVPQMAREIGMDFAALCEKIIEVSMEKYAG